MGGSLNIRLYNSFQFECFAQTIHINRFGKFTLKGITFDCNWDASTSKSPSSFECF